MYDESGFLLLLRVLMAILMFSMEMEIGEEKKKAGVQGDLEGLKGPAGAEKSKNPSLDGHEAKNG